MSLVRLDDLLSNLSVKQLKFTQAGIEKSPQWTQLESQLSLAEQIECLKYVAQEPEPLPKVKAMLRGHEIISQQQEHSR